MLYRAYQAQVDVTGPVRSFAGLANRALKAVPGPFGAHPLIRRAAAGYELMSRSSLTHERPAFGIDAVRVGGSMVRVREEAADVTPFGTLLHFAKDVDVALPRVLVVAPLSGHFATLLRDTVATLSADHDVYLTDWHNARDVPVGDGRFDFDDYITNLIRFLHVIGPGAHVVAVCQPCVAALAATAVMADGGDDATPRSLTLMAGPVDARVNPSMVNQLATSQPLAWFERNVISTVPRRYEGGGRRVYPGFMQLSAFVGMNVGRHFRAHRQLYEDLARGAVDEAEVTKAFYDEYFAVLDIPAEFYLETVSRVFQEFLLAKGELTYEGRPVDPAAIRRTSLFTVEGARDDICSVGQTVAAHDLCTSVKPARRRHHLQAGVGHYGVFSGRRWQTQIAPLVHNVILASD
ncbi:MAG: polyhydroxyalkanoate depolymerase [Acidimicrobiia bacterium]